MKLTVATRGSALALWQTEWVIGRLREHHGPDLEVEIQTIRTRGDQVQNVPLYEVGGKGVFVKEIEQENRLLIAQEVFQRGSQQGLGEVHAVRPPAGPASRRRKPMARSPHPGTAVIDSAFPARKASQASFTAGSPAQARGLRSGSQ